MVYGYARISQPKQSVARQIRNIKEFDSSAVIISEAYTGRKINRPEWDKLHHRLKPGDTVIFDSVSRMSRNEQEGTDLYEELFNAGIELVFLRERHVDTLAYKEAMQGVIELQGVDSATAEGELVNGIIAALNRFMMSKAKSDIIKAFAQAEKEVTDLSQRTREGIETARLNGKQIGQRQGAKLITRKSIAAKTIIERHSRDFNGTLNDTDVIKLAGLSRNTYYLYKRQLRDAREQG